MHEKDNIFIIFTVYTSFYFTKSQQYQCIFIIHFKHKTIQKKILLDSTEK